MRVLYLTNGATEFLYGESEQQEQLFYNILYEHLGRDAAETFQRLITKEDEGGDNYELIADGYRDALVNAMNGLEEVLKAKRLDRKRLENIYNDICNEV